MIKIKIGQFVKEHINNIKEYCETNLDELNKLLNIEYTKKQIGLGSNYSFFRLADKAENDRYWKSIYKINGIEYRICSQFGGSKKDEKGITRSQREGEKFIEYLSHKGLLLKQYKDEKVEFVVGDYNISSSDGSNNKQENTNIKNIILYGAPGVGKTHNYKNLISMIENGKSQKEIFDTISQNNEVSLDNDAFETIKQDKRVEFVTFHQSYSYEDFIEGFRPNENGDIELEDGIFKNISDKAQENLFLSNIEMNQTVVNIDELLNQFTNYVQDNIDKEIDFFINDKITIESINNKGAFVLGGSIKTNTQRLAKDIIKRDYNEFKLGNIKSYEDIKPTFISQREFHGNARYYFLLYKKLNEFELQLNSNANNLIKLEKIIQKNFYIVIDEINRGNISKIFGELITLIEEDKRDKYDITLPYSKESFKVPSNLYIIATMNSTDKSIATIDIALRRRFTFLKMKPNLDLVENPNAKNMMEKLNIYIEEKLGEDYKLGHSYFMNVESDEDLEFAKEYKIKPLLEEYFYSEDKSVDEILEEAIKNNKEINND